MRFLNRFAFFILLLTLLLPPSGTPTLTHAQTDATVAVQPVSTRYSLDVPSNWIVTSEQVRGLEGIFVDEIVAVGNSAESLASLADLDPTKAKLGQTLIANIFPAALAWTDGPTDDSALIWSNILGPDLVKAQQFEVSGLSAVQTRDYFGPPYSNAQFAGQTMIHDGGFIYFMIYSGQSEAELMELEAIAQSFTINTELAETRQFHTTDTALTLDIEAGWLVAQSSSGPSESFMIMPDGDAVMPYIFGGQYADTLPGLLIQVVVQPYDLLFGTVNTTVTDEDRAFVLDQAIGSTGGTPLGEVTELTIGEAPALQVDLDTVFSGANQGTIILVDSQLAMYSISFVGSAELWEADYLPIVETLIAGLQIEVTPPPELAEGEVPTGTQRGQLAPNFTTTLADGTPVSLSDYRGKVVLLNFWATWCPPCRQEMPEFETASVIHSDNLVVLAVNLLETEQQVNDFATELSLTFPLALDPDGSINQLYGVTGYPTSYLIDPNGVITAVNVGPMTTATIDQWVAIASQ